MPQIKKEREKKKKLSEEETSNLSDTELKNMVIRMLKEFGEERMKSVRT